MEHSIPQPNDAADPTGVAEAAAWRAVDERPDDPGAWHSLAFALIEVGKLSAARQALERAVALDPFAVMARNNLGVVLHRLGEVEAACGAYQAVLMLDADNAAAHGNLAGLLSEAGRFETALAYATRAAALDPTQLGPCVYAAAALANLGDTSAALDWLDRAVGLAPRNGRVLLERADLLRVLGRLDDALAACRQAVAQAPDDAKATNQLGLVLQGLGEDEAALAAFDRAVALAPKPGHVLINRAILLAEMGRREAALDGLSQALAADPSLAAGWMARAELKTFAPGDPDIAAMEAELTRAPLPRRDQTLLRYGLAKAYLDLQDGPRAFAHLAHGGRLQREVLFYDAEAAAREMQAIAAAFGPELFARLGSAGCATATPLFIIGMPRCGGTLVEQILASHPSVQAGGEARHIERLTSELGETYPAGVADLAPAAIAALGQRYLEMAAPTPGALRLTDKAANHFLHAGLILLILPGARIIHVRRDPIDTCLSCYSKLFAEGQTFSYDLTELGGYYRLYAALTEHWRTVLPPDRFLEVDYEAVVEDLEGQARRLISFCGLEWDEACLRFFETPRTIRTASLSQVRQPLYRSSVGRWRAFEAQLAPLIAAIGDQRR